MEPPDPFSLNKTPSTHPCLSTEFSATSSSATSMQLSVTRSPATTALTAANLETKSNQLQEPPLDPMAVNPKLQPTTRLSFKEILIAQLQIPTQIPKTNQNYPNPRGFDASTDVIVPILAEVIQAIQGPWKSAVILKVIGKSFSVEYLSEQLKKLWKLKTNPSLIGMGKGFYSVKSPSIAGAEKLIQDGPWFINGYYLEIRKWEPEFRPSLASTQATPKWFELPELPIEYHRIDVLKSIGNAIGKFAKADYRGAELNRTSYARICCLMEEGGVTPASVWLGNCKQQIVELHQSIQICKICHKEDSHSHKCHQNPATKNPTEPATTPIINGPTSPDDEGSPESEGWSTVAKKRKKTEPKKKNTKNGNGMG